MKGATRWPPAFAARWLEYRRTPAGRAAARKLDVHLGWDGRRPAQAARNAIWLPPDRDPARTDWRAARNTSPFVYGHDAAPEQQLAVCHALLAAGTELVVLYADGKRFLFTHFGPRA